MKKVLSMILALTTVASMASVAFAAVNDETTGFELSTDLYYYEKSDGSLVPGTTDLDKAERQPGETVYIPIGKVTYKEIADGTAPADKVAPATSADKDAVKKLKVATEWTVGKTATPTIVYKKVTSENASDSATFSNSKTAAFSKDSYYYLVAVEMPENSATKSYDLNGTIGIGTTSTKAKANTVAANFAIAYNKATPFSSGDQVLSTAPVVDFKAESAEDEACEILFGEELAQFTVNTNGQSALNLAYSTKFNSEFAAKYDYANIDFLSFKKSPSFNRTGEMKIYAAEDTFLYEVTADGAKAVKGAKYDADEGAFVFKTRTLSSYAISDVELKAVTEEEESKPAEEETSKPSDNNTSKPNPDTGR